MVVSDYAVQAIRGSNNAPKFADDQDPVTDDEQAGATREVAENTKAGQAIGDPVVAEDKDGDVLTYTLGGVDAALFAIDRATGQIMTKNVGALDFELETNTNSEYQVTVTATDPSAVPVALTDIAGTTSSDSVDVTIEVTNVNEAPEISGGDRGAAEVAFEESMGDIAEGYAYMAMDPDGADMDGDITWSVSGADAGKFNITAVEDDTGGAVLKFKAKPDFENPTDANTDDVYEVTVVAADIHGNSDTMDVKVTVTNELEMGVVTLSRTQPRVGVPVAASLTDPDGSISGLRWQWYRGEGNATECPVADSDGCLIKDATSDTYTPTEGDVGEMLRATAIYKDGFAEDATATEESVVVAEDSRNKPPAFVDQDSETKGTQNETATREVEENTKALAGDDPAAIDDLNDNVGSVVMAEDPDPNEDPLIFTLSGSDAALFRVRDSGQIEVGAGTKLDYETRTSYVVTLTAEDSFGERANIMVTITVTDLDEAPDVTGDATKEYTENGAGSVATYTAVDPEGATIRWNLSGADDSLFSIEGGVLRFKKAPDFEMAGTDNMYEVTVRATDSTRQTGTKAV